MRLLAQHRGQEILNIFDALVKPWVANAMGCELVELPYDRDLGALQIISLPEVHGASMLVSVNHLNPNTINPKGGNLYAGPVSKDGGPCHVRAVPRIDPGHMVGGEALADIQTSLKAISQQLEYLNIHQNKTMHAAQDAHAHRINMTFG